MSLRSTFVASWRKSASRRKRCTAGRDILLRRKQKHDEISTQRSRRTQSSRRSAGIFTGSTGIHRALCVRFFSPTMNTNRIRTVLEMIKFEHSVFALPFALTGALLAARATHQPPRGWPSLRQILWIIAAMVAARAAAMSIDRIADPRYDRANPRTHRRALATGAVSVAFASFGTLIAG